MFQRSTKGASKQRRDMINAEINIIKDLLPVNENVRRRLSQLQVMALCNSFIAKTNCFQNSISEMPMLESCFEFSEALSDFLMVLTTDGKMLYVSENVTQFLGHSMVDLMTQAESVFEIIDSRDQRLLRNFLTTASCNNKSIDSQAELAITCRMSFGKLIRKNNVFDRQKTLSLRGRMIWPGNSLNLAQPIFVASCTTVLSCLTNENSATVDTMMFTTSHSLEMKFLSIDHNGEFHLGGRSDEFKYQSWYQLIHPDDTAEAVRKHKELVEGGFDTAKSLCTRVQTKHGQFIWLHIVMRLVVPLGVDNHPSEIICLNHVISEREALEIREHALVDEEQARFTGACYGQAGMIANQSFLPTIVVDEGFLDQMSTSSVMDDQVKPVDYNRQELMDKLRRKAETGSKHSSAKRIKFDTESSVMSLESFLDDNDAILNPPQYHSNAVFDNIGCYSTMGNEANFVDFDLMTSSHARQTLTPPQAGPFKMADMTSVDIQSFLPLTPPSSVLSGGSYTEDCSASLNDDCVITSFSNCAALLPPPPSCTPPYSPPSGYSLIEESMPLNSVVEECSFFDGGFHPVKVSCPPPARPEVPMTINNHVRDDLPELPIDDIEDFFYSVESSKRLFDQLLSSPYLLPIVDDMMSSANHLY